MLAQLLVRKSDGSKDLTGSFRIDRAERRAVERGQVPQRPHIVLLVEMNQPEPVMRVLKIRLQSQRFVENGDDVRVVFAV